VDDAAETGAAGLLHLIRWMRMLLQLLLMFLLQPTSTHQDNDCVLFQKGSRMSKHHNTLLSQCQTRDWSPKLGKSDLFPQSLSID
jgi:hypothetical protein